jgi:hypothetical protein
MTSLRKTEERERGMAEWNGRVEWEGHLMVVCSVAAMDARSAEGRVGLRAFWLAAPTDACSAERRAVATVSWWAAGWEQTMADRSAERWATTRAVRTAPWSGGKSVGPRATRTAGWTAAW